MAINHHAITADHRAATSIVPGQELSNQAMSSPTNNGGLDFMALFASFMATSEQSASVDSSIVETDSIDLADSKDVTSNTLQSSDPSIFAGNVPVNGLVLPGSLFPAVAQKSDSDVSPTSLSSIGFSADKQRGQDVFNAGALPLVTLATDSSFYHGQNPSEILGKTLDLPNSANSTLPAANFAGSALSQAGLPSAELPSWLASPKLADQVNAQITEMTKLAAPAVGAATKIFPASPLGAMNTPQSLQGLFSMGQSDASISPVWTSNAKVIGDSLASILSDKKLFGKSNSLSYGEANGQLINPALKAGMVKEGDVAALDGISKKLLSNADQSKVASGLGEVDLVENPLSFGDAASVRTDSLIERAADSVLGAVDQLASGNRAATDGIASISGTIKPNGYDGSASTQLADTSVHRVSAKIDAWVGQPGWSDHLGSLLVNQVNNQVQSAEIAINPPQLGPIVVQIDMGKDQQVNVHFAAVQSATREAIQAALPRLDEILSASSISLGQTSVGSEQRQGQQGQSAEGYFATTRDQGGPAAIVPASTAEVAQSAKRSLRQNLSLVDFYA